MKTIEDDYIEAYGLKTWRKKQQLRRWDRDKYLLKLERELYELRNAKNNMDWIELEKPIQQGWKRFYVLRSDIIKSNEADFYQNILKRINTEKVCGRKDFMQKDRKTKKLEPVHQHTKWLRKSEFEKLNFTMKEQLLFEYKWVREHPESIKFRAFVYLCDWQFEFRVKKNIITHIQAHDTVLEKRIAELDNQVVYNFANSNRLANLHGKGIYKFWKDSRNTKGMEKHKHRRWEAYIEDN